MMLYNTISKYIEVNKLLCLGDKVLIALSGGPDSVALFRILTHLGYQCEAAHCNFHLRGKESDRDELFCKKLCEEWNVPLHVVDFQTEQYAEENGVSIEMAARTLRYDWFEKVRTEIGAAAVAVAHHLDDSVETFLLNLTRGTGIKGLKGIAAKNGYIIRPLLEVGRKDILLFLDELNQSYVTDSTNLENVYMRNKIRLDIIPLFSQINPSFTHTIAETAKRLAEVDAVYQESIANSLKRIKSRKNAISIARLKKVVAPSCVLYEWLSPYGFNSSQLKDIMASLDAEPGSVFLAKDKWKLVRDREELILENLAHAKRVKDLVTVYKDKTPTYEISHDKKIACLDADKLVFPLIVRKWINGDKFVPYGMKNRKSIASYLRDKKMPLAEKKEQLVVLSGKDIIWLVNERVDNRFCVTEETSKVVELSLKDAETE